MDDLHIDLFAAYNTTAPDWIPEDKRVQMSFGDEQQTTAAISSICPDVSYYTYKNTYEYITIYKNS